MDSKKSLPMLAVLYGAAFVAAFNENIINVALISIMNEFAVNATTAQWLVTGYMIVTAVVVTITAFLSRRFRLRSLFFAASALLAGGSVAAIFAPTFPILLVVRLVQAVGTGLFIPIMMSTVLAVAPRPRMGTFLSIGGCMITFGPAFAPVISGLMVTAFGWRSVFIPSAIIIVILAICGTIFIKNFMEPEKIKLDVPSVLLSAAGLSLLVYGLSVISSDVIPAIVGIVLGLACAALFVYRQHHIANPLLNLSPFANPLFRPVCLLVVVAMMTTFSMSVLLPLYFEGALGTTALVSGALLLAPILVNALTSLIGGRIMDARGSWPLLPVGFAIITVGQIGVCLLAPQLSWVSVLIASIVVYAGVGLIFSPSQTAGLQTLSHEQHPHGVAIINTFVQIAASIGPSLFIGVLSSVSETLQADGTAANVAQADGFSSAVAIAAAVALIGFVVSFVYARKRHRLAAAENVTGHEREVATGSTATPANKTRPAASEAAAQERQGVDDITIAHIMKKPFLVPSSASIRDVIALLMEHQTSGMPVIDEQSHLVGFVTDGDVLRSLGRQNIAAVDTTAGLITGLNIYRNRGDFSERFDEAMTANVMDIATTDVVAVTTQTSLDKACEILSSKQIKKVPVLDNGEVIGTLSRSDIVRTLMGAFVED